MQIEFWGVRGSIPTTGLDMVRTGGNTSCISICIEDKLFVFDAGTGIRKISKNYTHIDKVFLSITHPHWDHIQGLPFFDFMYDPSKEINFVDYPGSVSNKCAKSQMDGVFFPVKFDKLKSTINDIKYSDVYDCLNTFIDLSYIEVKHGSHCLGFKISTREHSIVYIPDNELAAYTSNEMESLVDFCRDVDYLIHDSQYTQKELEAKCGWGHSSWRECCDLAIQSSCKNIVLFHHDPSRKDYDIDVLEQSSKAYLLDKGSKITCIAAREGLKVNLV